MGKQITVYDDQRLLPANPDDWPSDLKAAIRACCCGQTSSSPGGGIPQPPQNGLLSCCDARIINSLSGNVFNTLSHDTGINWTYVPNVTLFPNGNGPEILPPGYPRAAMPRVPDPNPYFPGGGPVDSGIYGPAWYSDFFFDYEGAVGGETPFQTWGFPVNPPPFRFIYKYTYKVYFYFVLGSTSRDAAFLQKPICMFEWHQCCFINGTWTVETPAYVTPGGTPVPPSTFSAPLTYHDNYDSPSAFFPDPPPNGNPYGGLGGIVPINPYFGSTSNTAGWRPSAVMRSAYSLPETRFGGSPSFQCNPFLLRGNWNNAQCVQNYGTTIVSTQGRPEPYLPYNTNPGGATAPIIWVPQATIEPGTCVNGQFTYPFQADRPAIEAFE